MTTPLITIITPVYNGARYIDACLENVASQNCQVAEHLIMDGGSTDATVEIVEKWVTKNPNIRLISEKDNGQSDAMNKGIQKAKGQIISFLNVDDYYEPGVLNQIGSVFLGLPVPSLVCGNLNIWNADGTLRHFHRPTHVRLAELLSHRFEWPYNPSAYFYHKSLHEQTGLYNTDNHLCMDYEFILKAAAITDFIHIDQTWGNFVMVEGSKTQVSHSLDPESARKKAASLRQEAYERAGLAIQKEVDLLIAAGKVVEKKLPLYNRALNKLKNLLRF